ERREDMTLRLKVAGINPETLIEVPDLKSVITEIKSAPTEHVDILATYTAVLNLRKELIQQGFIKEGN
ncbi:DUF1727 domain-containing protein, partial [Acinetobacter baumannii]|nr:DUF1727 domain-containing protein [Acinetobacter baumannii]